MNRKQCEKPAQKDLEDVLLMYDAEIRQADDLFQNYIQKIRKLGWYDRAMIVLMSDHGEEFLDHGTAFHGQNVFPATSHVPLIIKFPAEKKLRGLRIPNRASLIDVMPTILETLGVHGPSEIQGQNLLGIIRGGSQNTERMMITENRKGIVGITRNHYHYVYTDLAARGWSCPPRKLEELYDLKTDPAEIHDLSTQLPDVLSLFRADRENFLSRAQKFRNTKLGSSRKVEPEEELKEQMKALGYVQ
jgi:arylsulfatase A-like enzyme